VKLEMGDAEAPSFSIDARQRQIDDLDRALPSLSETADHQDPNGAGVGDSSPNPDDGEGFSTDSERLEC
jgi:hypothetical protein